MKQLEPILFIVLIFAVFYFLLIRPQRKKQRDTQQMQQNLQPGVEVVTTAGMHARLVAFEGDDVLLEVAPGVTCKYLKQAVMRVVPDATQAAATPTSVVDATPEPVEEVSVEEIEAKANTEAKAETEAKSDESAADAADGATAAAEPAEAKSTDGTSPDGTSPDGKVDGAETAKAEESGTAKGDKRSAS